MTSTCITSLDLCAIRVTQLDSTGLPLSGTQYVSDAPISLGITINVETGRDTSLRSSCGSVISVFQRPDQIRGIEFDLDLCQLDSLLLEMMTGARIYNDAGVTLGFQLPSIGQEPPFVCFEGWTKAWSVDRQLAHPTTTPDATWIHWVFPLTRWVQGDFTLEHDLMVVPVSGRGYENRNMPDSGPQADWPAFVDGVTSLGGWFFDTTPPPAICDFATNFCVLLTEEGDLVLNEDGDLILLETCD